MRKLQAETAITVYHQDIVPTLQDRQSFVIDAIQAFHKLLRYDPTALELLDYVQKVFPSQRFDVNSIRPLLTELEMAGRVEKADKRICFISGKRVTTWRLRRPDRLF